MIILIQGIRSGAGASFLAASLAWQLSISSKKVLALSANDSDAPLELYFNFGSSEITGQVMPLGR